MPRHARQRNSTGNMETIGKDTFDALSYFKDLGERNKLAKANEFHVDYCSGPDGPDAVMAEYRDSANFLLVEDTTSGNTFFSKPRYFDRKVYAVYIIAGYEYGNEDSFREKLALCRKIFHQFLRKLIDDKAKFRYGKHLMYLNLETIYSQEYGRYSFNGATGLFFQVQNNEPLNLEPSPEDWEE